MSKHVEYTETILADKECLIEALVTLGLVARREEVRQGHSLVMRNYYGHRDERLTADLVLPSPHGYGDIGFKRTDKGYVPIADHFDLGEGAFAGALDRRFGGQPGAFLRALKRAHNVASVYAEARRHKGGVVREQTTTTKAGKAVRKLVVSWD